MSDITQQVTDGYCVLWAIAYKDGQFWYCPMHDTTREKRGTSCIHIYRKAGNLYFNMQDVVSYITYGQPEMTKDELIETAKAYMTYSPTWEYISILPNVSIGIEANTHENTH